MWVGVFAAIILFLSSPVGATDVKGALVFTIRQFAAAEAGKTCAVRLPRSAVSFADLTGDGVPEAIVDFAHAACPPARGLFEGTGGFRKQVWRWDGSTATILLDGNMFRLTTMGTTLVTLERGFICNGQPQQLCRRTLVWDATKGALRVTGQQVVAN